MSVPVEKFMSLLAAKLNLSANQPNLNSKIVFAVMQLPDISPLFQYISIKLNVSQQLLLKTFFEQAQQHLTTQQLNLSLRIDIEHKFKVVGHDGHNERNQLVQLSSSTDSQMQQKRFQMQTEPIPSSAKLQIIISCQIIR
ncbi:Hypothetical_protein [Hexamita inflata]|uniref:Hypothetical_protein n=1 Tax=Hexamita inflata TaxID=28002 RepID=A0ABP1GGE0_9EUKA